MSKIKRHSTLNSLVYELLPKASTLSNLHTFLKDIACLSIAILVYIRFRLLQSCLIHSVRLSDLIETTVILRTKLPIRIAVFAFVVRGKSSFFFHSLIGHWGHWNSVTLDTSLPRCAGVMRLRSGKLVQVADETLYWLIEDLLHSGVVLEVDVFGGCVGDKINGSA
jgi:hypothetical protein